MNGSDKTALMPKVRPKTLKDSQLRRPPKYKVLLHNDDYTPREFVVAILRAVFRRRDGAARAIMLYIHRHGVGIVGIYTKEIAETKVMHVMTAAERAGHPLLCTMEPADDGDKVPTSSD